MLKKTVPAFVQKTWNLLESGQFRDVICWNEQGDAFRIVNDHEFEHTVLPAYFKHSNLTSFQRQLNMYNFHKRKLQNGQTEYHHRLFRMHQKELLLAIRRKPSQDEIEIGEELLRKLAMDHEETHHDNQHRDKAQPSTQQLPLLSPTPTQENLTALTPANPPSFVQFQVQLEQVPEKPISYQIQQINYTQFNYGYPYYYIPNAYGLPSVVAWCPQRKIKTYVLVQSPAKHQPIY